MNLMNLFPCQKQLECHQRGVTFHSLLVTRCKITRYSLQNSLVTHCRSCSLQKITNYSLQKLLVTKKLSLLVAKFARYSLQKFTRYSLQNLLVTKNHLLVNQLLVAEVARCKNSLVTSCKIRLLLFV